MMVYRIGSADPEIFFEVSTFNVRRMEKYMLTVAHYPLLMLITNSFASLWRCKTLKKL
jgi:hypothetical protein